MLNTESTENPDRCRTGRRALSVPLYTMYKDIAEVINSIIAVVFQKPEDDGTLSRLGKKFEYNLAVVSGIDPDKINQSDEMPVFPHELKNKSAFELINMYLAGTPFVDFSTPPFLSTCHMTGALSTCTSWQARDTAKPSCYKVLFFLI